MYVARSLPDIMQPNMHMQVQQDTIHPSIQTPTHLSMDTSK